MQILTITSLSLPYHKNTKNLQHADINHYYSFVVSANSYDGTTAIDYWESLSIHNCLMENIKYIYADGTFRGTFSKKMTEKYSISVEIPKIPIAQKGKVKIHEKRWIVERTITWTLNNRRCSKDYERKTEHANTYLTIANIRRIT